MSYRKREEHQLTGYRWQVDCPLFLLQWIRYIELMIYFPDIISFYVEAKAKEDYSWAIYDQRAFQWCHRSSRGLKLSPLKMKAFRNALSQVFDEYVSQILCLRYIQQRRQEDIALRRLIAIAMDTLKCPKHTMLPYACPHRRLDDGKKNSYTSNSSNLGRGRASGPIQ